MDLRGRRVAPESKSPLRLLNGYIVKFIGGANRRLFRKLSDAGARSTGGAAALVGVG